VNSQSIAGLLLLALDVWAIISTVQSGAANRIKLIWTLVILLLPFLGLVIWLLVGPRGARAPE
jgi:hypothetical protein